MRSSIPSVQTQRVRLRFIGLREGGSFDSDLRNVSNQNQPKAGSPTGHQGVKHLLALRAVLSSVHTRVRARGRSSSETTVVGTAHRQSIGRRPMRIYLKMISIPVLLLALANVRSSAAQDPRATRNTNLFREGTRLISGSLCCLPRRRCQRARTTSISLENQSARSDGVSEEQQGRVSVSSCAQNHCRRRRFDFSRF